jgi:hypothetical protein
MHACSQAQVKHHVMHEAAVPLTAGMLQAVTLRSSDTEIISDSTAAGSERTAAFYSCDVCEKAVHHCCI